MKKDITSHFSSMTSTRLKENRTSALPRMKRNRKIEKGCMGLIHDGRNQKIRIVIPAVVTKVENMGCRQASSMNLSVPSLKILVMKGEGQLRCSTLFWRVLQ